VAGLLIVPGGVAVVTAGVGIWLAGRRRINPRYFAGAVAIAVTTSIFSVVAWVVTTTAHGACLPIASAFIGALSLLFGLRLYSELQAPRSDNSC
jgi:hypothetical protein